MQRNPLCAGHLTKQVFLIGLSLVSLSACAVDNPFGTMPWESSPPPVIHQPVTPQVVPQSPTAQAQPTQQQNVAKVALLIPLTGKGSDTGQAMLNAAQLAMFDLNASSLFELIPQDTGEGAVHAAQSAIGSGANMILGPLFSEDAKAIAPLAAQNNLNVVSFSTDTSAASNSTYLMGFMPHTQVEQILLYAAGQGKHRIALIAPRNVYGDSVAASFADITRRYNIGNAGIIRTNTGAVPANADLTPLKAASGVDAVLIASPALDANKISNALTAAGFTPSALQRLGTGLWDQPDAPKLSGLQDAWYAASSPRLRSRFESRYFETYGTQAPRVASLAYDATALAVVLAKSGRGFGRDALTNPNGFFGIDGVFRFQANGLAERGLAILQIQNGSAHVLLDAPQRFAQNSSD